MTVTVLPRRQERAVHRPYMVLAAMQVLDITTTWVILQYWAKAGERNPLIAGLIDHAGLHVAMVVLLVAKLAVVALMWHCQTGVRLATAIYGLVLANNVIFLGLWAAS